MTTIFERVKTALGTLSPAVPNAQKPFLAVGALPDVYIDYQLIDGSPESHFDNREATRDYLVQVSIWSRAGLANLPNVDGAMTAAGFMPGDERELPKAETGHFGLAKDYVILIKQS